MKSEITSLRVSRSLRNRLAQLGTKDETFEEIIEKLIEKGVKN